MNDLDHTMSCEHFAERLPALLERELDDADRAAAEGHAVRCRDCGPLLADLRKLRLDAANMRDIAPSRDLWSGIEARIQPEVISIGHAPSGESERARRVERRLSVRAAAWAAAALVVVTAGLTYALVRGDARDTPEVRDEDARVAQAPVVAASFDTNPAAPALVGNVSMLPVAAQATTSSYSTEIGRLREILDARRTSLNPATVTVVERNLRAIDEAIAQVKDALVHDPGSSVLLESLSNAYETKIDLLRTVTTMEMEPR